MRPVTIRYNVRLPTRDGLELSANLFMPEAAPGEKFPAVLEMIPYRKDDWRYLADHQRMTYFAQRGYVGCRVDVRGTGSSQGIARDEYTPDESRDGYDAVEWLAAQPWCNGRVGMWGISYGGFTAIQTAMLRPPHLQAIVPMYATDDRYTDDVHYLGGCPAVSELAQYAVSQVAMNALPPKPPGPFWRGAGAGEYASDEWIRQWKERLEQTPCWPIEWLRHQTDGPYWRSGSLAPDYARIQCAIFHIAGWMDGYPDPALRMQAHCTAPRKTLIGSWAHLTPDHAYPGPTLDYLHEMVRFFDHWLKGADNGVMDDPPLTYFRREYTPPEAFPRRFNGEWAAAREYHPARLERRSFFLGRGALMAAPPDAESAAADHYPHRPAWGTAGPLTWGAGAPPTGLARDLRPDEAQALTYTSQPFAEPFDLLGAAEAHLHLSAGAPVAHVAVRLSDVAPDGTSALVTMGLLNLTHRDGHADPRPLVPGQIYAVTVPCKATAYRFLPGHRLRLTIASACWPLIWPSPHPADNQLHRGPAHPSRLTLPSVSAGSALPPPQFKTTPPELIEIGGGSELPAEWRIIDDVMNDRVTVELFDGDVSRLPDGVTLATDERLAMTACHHEPARARVDSVVNYQLTDGDHRIEVRSTGAIRSTASDFHIDMQLTVKLDGNEFFRRRWLETVPRQLT